MRKLTSFFILGLMALGLCGPAIAAPWPDATFGDGLGVQVKVERTTPGDLARLEQLGLSYLRYDMHWGDVEREAGVYDWSKFDKFIESLRARKIKSLIILSGGNKNYTGEIDVPPEKFWGYKRFSAAPHRQEDYEAFARFAAAAAARYEGAGDIIWEIWNEPDNDPFWPPKQNPQHFAGLATATCQAIRAAAPDATIIAAGLAGLPSIRNAVWGGVLRELLQSPASKCLSAVSVHPYRWKKPPEDALGDYANNLGPFIAAFTPKGQKPLPYLNSEWGYPATTTTPEQQAAYAVRMRLVDLLAGVPLSIIYEWKDSRAPKPGDAETSFGMLTYAGADKPAAQALVDALAKLKDAAFVKKLPQKDPGAYAVLLRLPDGAQRVAAWLGEAQNRPAQARIADKSYELTIMPQIIDVPREFK